jgi:cyclase
MKGFLKLKGSEPDAALGHDDFGQRGHGTVRSSVCRAFGAFIGILLAASPALAQSGSAAAGLETIEIRPNVFVIFGAGSNIAVHLGEDGVILVDSGRAEMAEQVLAAVRAISNKPIRLIINTSADADHTGGNQTLAVTGLPIADDAFSVAPTAAVLAHENVLLRLSEGTDIPYESWPTETYTSRYRSMYLNGDGVQLIRAIGAHSDGDSIVLFRRADVVVTGDILDLRHFPVIDVEKGGSIQGELAALNRLLDIVIPAMPFVLRPDRTLVVPGHGYVSDYAEIVEYQNMLTIIYDRIKDLADKGMTVAQVKEADPTAGYRARYGADSGPWTTSMFVEAVYAGIKNPPEEP